MMEARVTRSSVVAGLALALLLPLGWLLAHLPMDKGILRKWLKAGFMDQGTRYPTEAGTPQEHPKPAGEGLCGHYKVPARLAPLGSHRR